jgi:hypothetical protein
MGTMREVVPKKIKTYTSLDMPVWLYQAESLPHRNFITHPEKELVDLVRLYGEFSKADLATFTEYSRTKITTCIDSLLDKKIITANNATEYTGGRRSKTFSLNGNLCLVAGVDIGATSVDLVIADFSGKLLVRYSEPASVKDGPIKVLGQVCSLLEKMLKESIIWNWDWCSWSSGFFSGNIGIAPDHARMGSLSNYSNFTAMVSIR